MGSVEYYIASRRKDAPAVCEKSNADIIHSLTKKYTEIRDAAWKTRTSVIMNNNTTLNCHYSMS